MSNIKAIIKDSFKITGVGIIVELQHFKDGLNKETVLVSEKSGKTWTIISRILFNHAVNNQKIFDNESTKYMLLNFESDEKRQKSIDKIKESESQYTYQYFLKPIGHSGKPESEEIVIIR